MVKKLFLPLLLTCSLFGREVEPKETKEPEPPEIGNFSLPLSQQVAPLVSFGQTLIGKGVAQVNLFADGYYGKDYYFHDIYPGVLWGITDDLALYLNFPVSPGNKDGTFRSDGIEDITAQVEWAFYSKSSAVSYTTATVVFLTSFPSGSLDKTPSTGYGSFSFFLGATLSYATVDWMFYTNYGMWLPTPRERYRVGDQFYYEFGVERHLPSPCGWIFAMQLEFDGIYYWKDRDHGEKVPDTGGNVAYLTPSLWFSNKKWVFQVGAGYPVIQHLFGDQSKTYLSVYLNIGYTL